MEWERLMPAGMPSTEQNITYDETGDAGTEYLYDQAMAPALTAAVAALGLCPGWHVLDAGCGPGGASRIRKVPTSSSLSRTTIVSSAPCWPLARCPSKARSRPMGNDANVPLSQVDSPISSLMGASA